MSDGIGRDNRYEHNLSENCTIWCLHIGGQGKEVGKQTYR